MFLIDSDMIPHLDDDRDQRGYPYICVYVCIYDGDGLCT